MLKRFESTEIDSAETRYTASLADASEKGLLFKVVDTYYIDEFSDDEFIDYVAGASNRDDFLCIVEACCRSIDTPIHVFINKIKIKALN